MDATQRENSKNYFLKKMKSVRENIRERLAERAVDNMSRYYGLLYSTGEKGMEDLVAAIHASTFTTSPSGRHHRYPSGTMEHCLGVYKLMSQKAADLREKGYEIRESDVILVALLHDVGNGRSGEWLSYKGHGLRGKSIVERYLPEVSPQVLDAICFHMHTVETDNVLQKLVRSVDWVDAATCSRGRVRLSDTEVCML